MTENIRNVTEINPNGKYLIQFPEGTSPEVKAQMDELLASARRDNKNVYLEPGVKAIELERVAQVEVVQPTRPEPIAQPVPTPAPVQQPVPQPVQAAPQMQPAYMMDPNGVVMAYPRYFAVPQQYNHQQQAPEQVYMPGVAPGYAIVQQPRMVPVQNVPQPPVYNPQFAEGPIGQQQPTQQPQPVPQRQNASATVNQPMYTMQPPQQ